MVACGPVGRYVGGVILGWNELDREDGGGVLRLRNGIIIGVGMMLSLITAALAYTTISLVLSGHLTIDRERHRSHTRALHAMQQLQSANQPIPPNLSQTVERYSDKLYFFVPLPELGKGKGEVVDTLPGERVYDLGRNGNWEMVMGKGWGWVLPWNAVRMGMGKEIYNWPIAPAVEKRLREEARRRYQARGGRKERKDRAQDEDDVLMH